MTRTELLALADALEKCNPYRNSASVYQAADFLRQIAEAQPVGWRTEQTMKSGEVYRDCIAGERKPYCGVARLYTLPLED